MNDKMYNQLLEPGRDMTLKNQPSNFCASQLDT